MRSGADSSSAERVVAQIKPKLFPGIPTKQIYKMAYELLKGSSRFLAARYRLKKAIMELGPSGFPFEKFVAGVLSEQGYTVKVGQFLEGKCVRHEIDIVAEKGYNYYLIECKYHNQAGIFCDVKVPLYINSRFYDVVPLLKEIPEHASKVHQGWVVTNTKFSRDAIKYGNCAGLNLLSWDYPSKKGLKDQIDSLGLYPITCLTTLTRSEKQKLLDDGIVMCKEVPTSVRQLESYGMSRARIDNVLSEIDELCSELPARRSPSRK